MYMQGQASARDIPHYHAVVGTVDVKVKVVAPGQAGEAVSIHCSRPGAGLNPLDMETELSARQLLAEFAARASRDGFKVIPQTALTSTGIKIHAGKSSAASGMLSDTTLQIFDRVCDSLEHDSGMRSLCERSEAAPVGPSKTARSTIGSGSVTEHALRREIARIILSGQHVDTKVSDILRLVSH